MKKTIYMTLLFILICVFPAMASKMVCEPESDTAVSYGVYSVPKNNIDITFEKYATSDGQNDNYWIRISERTMAREKLLYYITLVIDGRKYKVDSVEPTEKYINASATFTAGPLSTFPRTNYKYYPLSRDLIDKIEAAKSITILYNKLEMVNIPISIDADFLTKIQDTFKLSYADYPKYWKPAQWKQIPPNT